MQREGLAKTKNKENERNNLKSADIVVFSIHSAHAIDGSDVGVSADERNTEADIGLHFVRAKHAEVDRKSVV